MMFPLTKRTMQYLHAWSLNRVYNWRKDGKLQLNLQKATKITTRPRTQMKSISVDRHHTHINLPYRWRSPLVSDQNRCLFCLHIWTFWAVPSVHPMVLSQGVDYCDPAYENNKILYLRFKTHKYYYIENFILANSIHDVVISPKWATCDQQDL